MPAKIVEWEVYRLELGSSLVWFYSRRWNGMAYEQGPYLQIPLSEAPKLGSKIKTTTEW